MIERIIQKIGRIDEYLNIIESIKHECRERFDKDPLYRGAMLHYLYLMADTCIVLAEMVIKKRGLRPPQYYAESFDILADGGVLESSFAFSFAKIAGFRNFLAHDYEQVEAQIVCDIIIRSLADVRTYIHQIKTSLALESDSDT